MTKEEWKKHCEWLDTFRGKIIDNEVYKHYGEEIKKKEKKKKKKT